MHTRNISSIQFGFMREQDVLASSVAEITSPRIENDALKTSVTREEAVATLTESLFGTVYDLRMGPLNTEILCPTCDQKTMQCPGHFGHISFATPIAHPMLYDYIKKCLNCICIQCNRLLFSESHLQIWKFARLQGQQRLNAILDRLAKSRECFSCNIVQPKILFNAIDSMFSYSYSLDGNVETAVVLRPADIQRMFRVLTDNDVRLIGLDPVLSHPSSFLITALPVLPPRARPYITSNIKHDDDLTFVYTKIVKANNSLRELDPTNAKADKHMSMLIYWVKALLDNSKGKAEHNNSKVIRGLKERLSSKDGLVRSNLMGKRQNQSARSVIGPDPTLHVDEIGIPNELADTLTYPEKASELNIWKLQKLLDGGMVHTVDREQADGAVSKYRIASRKIKFKIQIGDVVHRKLQDGEYAIVNRQPSLHKGSMMAKKLVRRPGKTIRLNLAVTASFNADFDGDEMNIFTPQSEQSRAELEVLSSTSNHIVSAQTSRSNLTIVQDCLLGAYLMTYTPDSISREDFFQMCMSIENLDLSTLSERVDAFHDCCSQYGVSMPKYCGKLLFSLLLPQDLLYTTVDGAASPHIHPTDLSELVEKTKNPAGKNTVIIHGGNIISGFVTKANLGSAHYSLIRLLEKEYSPSRCIEFINNVQFLANAYILYHGFSIGIGDCRTSTASSLRSAVEECLAEVSAHYKVPEASRERRVALSLLKARDVGMRMAKQGLAPSNRFLHTATSGSKGDLFNIIQVHGLLGQQNVSGKLIQPAISKKSRVLPHYSFQASSRELIEARGFITSSFMKGLSPQEFWNHASSGREGITDTSLKTSDSGYAQRKMVKILEDLHIAYDGTVRNSVQTIVQFRYGSDGLDGAATVIRGGKTPLVCDIERLVDRLNFQAENVERNRDLENETSQVVAESEDDMMYDPNDPAYEIGGDMMDGS